MHACLVLITKNLPTNEDISNYLARFDEENLYKEDENGVSLYQQLTTKELKEKYPFQWDCWQVGGRYGGRIKYKLEEEDYRYLDHNINMKKIRSNFYDKIQERYDDPFSKAFNKEVDECEFVNYIGRRDNILYCDGAKISTIQNIEEIKNDFDYCLYDAINDVAIAREYWDKNEWKNNGNFQSQMKEIIEKNTGAFLTIIDIHY